MKDDNIAHQSPAVIQRLAPRLPVERVLLLVRSQDYGSEGVAPVDERACPYYQQHASMTGSSN